MRISVWKMILIFCKLSCYIVLLYFLYSRLYIFTVMKVILLEVFHKFLSSTQPDFFFVQSKSIVRCSDSGDGDSKSSPPGHSGKNKEHLSSIIREISQTRLITLRKKRSGQSMTLGISDNGNKEANSTKWYAMYS